jgi:predicted PurR-regulated permease PerM
MRVNGLTKGFFILILLMVSLAFFNVLSPYYSAILWAAILSVIFNPVKNKLRARLGESAMAGIVIDRRDYLPDCLHPAGDHHFIAGD